MARLEGTQLGNYELLEHIGTGGMAEVYRARQRNAFGREVAIKVIKRGFAADPLFRQRFLREGQANARLTHPHILPLIELGQVGRKGERLFLVMPYVRGGTLRNLLAQRAEPLPIEIIAPLFLQLCEAVQYAHEQGLVHRDIKPNNILLQNEHYALLADFGIALDIEDVRLTSTGMGLGTPEYTAPEQAKGIADTRSDLYSLGVVLFELLTGRVPFTGRTPFEVLYQHTTAPVPSLRTAAPELPEPLVRLDALIQEVLAKEPARRFQTANALREAFHGVISSEGTSVVSLPDASEVEKDALQDERAGHIPSLEAWSPPHAFLPLPATVSKDSGSESDGQGIAILEAWDDQQGERPTLAASQPARAREFARMKRPPPHRRGPLVAIAMLAAVLLGGAAIVFISALLSGFGNNSFINLPTPGATASPQLQSTSSLLPTTSPQGSPVPTLTPTTSASPSPTTTPTPTSTPTSSPTPSITPTPPSGFMSPYWL